MKLEWVGSLKQIILFCIVSGNWNWCPKLAKKTFLTKEEENGISKLVLQKFYDMWGADSFILYQWENLHVFQGFFSCSIWIEETARFICSDEMSFLQFRWNSLLAPGPETSVPFNSDGTGFYFPCSIWMNESQISSKNHSPLWWWWFFMLNNSTLG